MTEYYTKINQINAQSSKLSSQNWLLDEQSTSTQQLDEKFAVIIEPKDFLVS